MFMVSLKKSHRHIKVGMGIRVSKIQVEDFHSYIKSASEAGEGCIVVGDGWSESVWSWNKTSWKRNLDGMKIKRHPKRHKLIQKHATPYPIWP